jgi:uncharacterized SAM-binding protein YcdF (DUF218 family)
VTDFPIESQAEQVSRIPVRTSRSLPSELRRWLVALGITLVLAIALLGGSLFAAIYLAARSDHERAVDAILVMGAAQFDGRPSAVLKARLDTTLQVWEGGVAPLIIVTGGKLPGDRFTESEASRNYLVERGVPEAAILLENEGSTTQTSLEHAAEIARAHDVESVLIVTDGFHMFRSRLIAERSGLDTTGVAVQDGPIEPWSANELDYVAREAAAIVAYLFF